MRVSGTNKLSSRTQKAHSITWVVGVAALDGVHLDVQSKDAEFERVCSSQLTCSLPWVCLATLSGLSFATHTHTHTQGMPTRPRYGVRWQDAYPSENHRRGWSFVFRRMYVSISKRVVLYTYLGSTCAMENTLCTCACVLICFSQIGQCSFRPKR